MKPKPLTGTKVISYWSKKHVGKQELEAAVEWLKEKVAVDLHPIIDEAFTIEEKEDKEIKEIKVAVEDDSPPKAEELRDHNESGGVNDESGEQLKDSSEDKELIWPNPNDNPFIKGGENN